MISKLTNDILMERFDKLVRTERKISHLVLEYIAEIEDRKLYLDRAFPNLFAFLTTACGYSDGAASRRIKAARALREIPEIGEKLEQGTLNLSQIAMVQHSCREVEKQSGQTVTLEQKRELLHKVQSATTAETQIIIAQDLGIQPTVVNRQQNHADRSVTLTMTFSPEQIAILQQAKALHSHELNDGTWADLFVLFASKAIDHKTKIRRPSPRKFQPGADRSRDHEDHLPKKARSIRPLDRKLLLSHGKCEFRDSVTGRTCNSTHFPQIDHRKPVAHGGGRHPENLRILCAAHNRHVYRSHSASEWTTKIQFFR